MLLRAIDEGDRELLENLFNLYRNDLSAYTDDFRRLDERGYFEYGAADELLPFGDGVETYIICDEGSPAGLIMVTDGRYALEGCQWRFQELYLIRPARGRGLARAAARELLNRKPGRWCLSVYSKNLPARRFWEKLIGDCGTLSCKIPGEPGMTDMIFDTNACEMLSSN